MIGCSREHFCSPSVLITVIFILIPVADSVVKSFLSYKVKNIISGTPGEWNNFANYIKLFQNGKLGMAIVHTLLFVAAVVVAQFLLGMALALILNADIRFSRFVRSIMMAPWVVPTIISGLIWWWLISASVRITEISDFFMHRRKCNGFCNFE